MSEPYGPDIAHIVNALVTTLDALQDHEIKRQAEITPTIKAYTVEQMRTASDRGEFFAEDPIGYGLRKAVRKAGQLIGNIAGSDMMESVADRAAHRDGKWSRWRSIVIDKNWDGLSDKEGKLLWAA